MRRLMTDEEWHSLSAKSRHRINMFVQEVEQLQVKGAPEPPDEPIHIWVDGGCYNNGTLNAWAYWSMTATYPDSKPYRVIRSAVSSDLPQTNNVAEYYALKMTLFWVRTQQGGRYIIHTDSQLAIGQLTQGWKVKADTIKQLWAECAQLLDELPNVRLVKEPREKVEAVLGH